MDTSGRKRCAVVRRRHMTVVALVLLGCALPREEPSEPRGVTERFPTGHADVASGGLVASYDMTTLTAEGLLRDFSGRGSHGRVSGTVATSGVRGGARLFGAATDRVELPPRRNFDLNGPLSIAVWFRFDREGQHQHLVACDDKFAVWLTPDDHFRFGNAFGDGLETTTSLSSETWHSVIGIFRDTAGAELDDANVEVWVDGSQAPSTIVGRSRDGPIRWRQGTLYERDACYIGFESHQGQAAHQRLPFFGAIDELQIFERALTQAEVQALAGTGP